MKILIWIPSYQWTIPMEIYTFLNNMVLPEGCTKNIIMTKRTPITTARNLMAKKAIKEWYDYLLFMDDDNIPENKYAVSTLIEDDKDIACWYYKDRNWNELVLFNKLNYDKNKFTYKNVKHINMNKWQVQEIWAAWTGFMLIKTEVLKDLYIKYNWEIFEYKRMDFYKGKEYMFTEPLLDIEDSFSFFMSEDICFCHRAMENWYKTWFDLRVPVLHIGKEQIIRVGNDNISRSDNIDVTIISNHDISSEITRHCDSNYEFLQGDLNDILDKAQWKYIIYMDNILLSKWIDLKLIEWLQEAIITWPQTVYWDIAREWETLFRNNNIVTHCWCMKKEDLEELRPICTNITDFSMYDTIKKNNWMCWIVDWRVHLFTQK